jgi:hypothetical protein
MSSEALIQLPQGVEFLIGHPYNHYSTSNYPRLGKAAAGAVDVPFAVR